MCSKTRFVYGASGGELNFHVGPLPIYPLHLGLGWRRPRLFEQVCVVELRPCIIAVYSRGVYLPTTMALFPQLSRLTLPLLCHYPPSANNVWTFYEQFCAILCVFAVNFGSCQG